MVRRHTPRHVLVALAAISGLAACTITTEVPVPDTGSGSGTKVNTKKKSPAPAKSPAAKASPSAVPSDLPAEMPTRPPVSSAPPRPSFGPNDFPLLPPSAMPTSVAATLLPVASPSPTTDWNALPSSSPSAFIQTSAPPVSGRLVILSGNVYDEEGMTVDNAIITVKSLDASVPYSATATSQGGSWVVNNVPEGANVEISAVKEGWTKRRRVGSFQQQATGRRNVVNFGAAGGEADDADEDPTGEAYFISDYPEIVATSPADRAIVTDASRLIYKLTFSEPLTEGSRANLEDAFVLWPANDAATLGGTAVDLTRRADDPFDDAAEGLSTAIPGDGTIKPGNVPYVITEGTAFNGSTTNRARFTWNADGTEATLTFDAPLRADSNDAAAYQAGLVLRDLADELEDEDGNLLGTGKDGQLDSYGGLAVGQPIRNVFKEADLSLGSSQAGATDDRNWGATHASIVGFEVEEDDTDPKLTAVDVTTADGDLLIELTFSEPMGACAGDGVLTNPGLDAVDPAYIRNFTFALGEADGDLDAVELGGDQAGTVVTAQGVAVDAGEKDARAATSLLAALPDLAGTEFSFDPQSVVETPAAFLTPGQVAVSIDDDDPKVVVLRVHGRASFFDGADELKARVVDAGDPAGNAITEASADANQVTASI